MRKFLLVLGLLGIIAVAVVVVKKKHSAEADAASISGAESFNANN